METSESSRIEKYRGKNKQQLIAILEQLEKDGEILQGKAKFLAEPDTYDEFEENQDNQADNDIEIKFVRMLIDKGGVGAGQTEETKKALSPRPSDNANMVNRYFDSCKELNMSKPTTSDLERVTGISSSTWNRHLRDPFFLGALLSEVKKRQSYRHSKKKETREKWKNVEVGVVDLIEKAPSVGDALTRGRSVKYLDQTGIGSHEDGDD